MEENQNIELTQSLEEVVNDVEMVEIEGENIEFAVVEDENAVHIMPVVDGEIVDSPVVDVEVINEPIDEEVNDEPIDNPEDVEEFEEDIQEPISNGVVAGCKQLNVRENPSKDAKVICIIPEGKEVTFSPAANDFCQVNFEFNDMLYVGYCMQKFIKLK